MNNVDSIKRHLQARFPDCHISIESKGWPYQVEALVLDAPVTRTSSEYLDLQSGLEQIFGGSIHFDEVKGRADMLDSMDQVVPGYPSELRIDARGEF